MSRARIGLLTGPVGVGKTTIAERVVGLARQRGLVCAGFLAPAMLTHGGQKSGIWGVDILSGEHRVLARTDRDPAGLSPSDPDLSGPSVGAYAFDGAALAWATELVEDAVGACDLLVVDEIGKLELWRGIGLAPILPRLASGQVQQSLVLVRDFLLAELQSRLGSTEQLVFRAGQDNRGELPPCILEGLFGPVANGPWAVLPNYEEEQQNGKDRDWRQGNCL
jgi:nucleoside-triphosphatase THEP1